MKKFYIHPATWLFLLLLIMTGFGSVLIPYMIAITLHELGHAYMAKKLGYGLNKIWLLPYGACISFDQFSFDAKDEIKIALAGPLTNVCLIILTVMSWWLFPVTYVYTYIFALANFSIASINLLPAFPLDGGRILTGALRLKCKPQKVYKISYFFNLFFSICFLIFFFISCFSQINFSLGLMGIFLFIGIIDGKFQGKYAPLLYEIDAHSTKKEIQQINAIYFSSNTPFYKVLSQIDKHKYNLFYISFHDDTLKMMTQKQFQKIISKHPLNLCFDEIYKKNKSQ